MECSSPRDIAGAKFGRGGEARAHTWSPQSPLRGRENGAGSHDEDVEPLRSGLAGGIYQRRKRSSSENFQTLLKPSLSFGDFFGGGSGGPAKPALPRKRASRVSFSDVLVVGGSGEGAKRGGGGVVWRMAERYERRLRRGSRRRLLRSKRTPG